jgi:hypothetical protein
MSRHETDGLPSPGEAGVHQVAAGAVGSLERVAVAGIGHTRALKSAGIVEQVGGCGLAI